MEENIPQTALNSQSMTNYFSLTETIAEVFATLVFGEGIFFDCKNKDVQRWFEQVKKVNKLEQLVWKVLRNQSITGYSGIKFDVLEKENDLWDVRFSFLNQFNVGKGWEDIIYADLMYYPFSLEGNRNFELRVREIWHLDKIIRYFYFHNKILPFSLFQAKIPDKYWIKGEDYIKTWIAGFSETKVDENTLYYSQNHLKLIPLVFFQNLTAKPDLDHNQKWDELVAELFAEIRFDLKLSRPIMKITTLSDEMKKWVEEIGFPPSVFVETKTLPTNTDLTPIAAKARFSELTQTLEKLIIFAFNQANLSYVSQLGTTSAKTEEIKQSYGAKTVQIKRAVFNNDLKILFDKVFSVVFREQKIEYDIGLRKPFDEEKQIQAVAQAKAFGLIDQSKAVEQINQTTGERTEEIVAKVKKTENEQQQIDTAKTFTKIDTGDKRQQKDNDRTLVTPEISKKNNDST